MPFGRCSVTGTLVGCNNTLCERESLTPRGRGDWGLKSQPNCQTISPMVLPGEYTWGVAWICDSDSALCQITLVLVSLCIQDVENKAGSSDEAEASWSSHRTAASGGDDWSAEFIVSEWWWWWQRLLRQWTVKQCKQQRCRLPTTHQVAD